MFLRCSVSQSSRVGVNSGRAMVYRLKGSSTAEGSESPQCLFVHQVREQIFRIFCIFRTRDFPKPKKSSARAFVSLRWGCQPRQCPATTPPGKPLAGGNAEGTRVSACWLVFTAANLAVRSKQRNLKLSVHLLTFKCGALGI